MHVETKVVRNVVGIIIKAYLDDQRKHPIKPGGVPMAEGGQRLETERSTYRTYGQLP